MALYTLAPQPWLIFLDDAGLYVPNGQLAVYAAGTSTPATVYTSAAGTAHPFPITLDGAGRVPGGLYLEPGRSYKVVLHAPQIEDPLDGAILKTQDHVAATPSSLVSVLTLAAPGDYPALNVSGVDILEYTGAGDVTIRGMTGGVLGQSILIRNLTTSVIWLSSSDPAAPAGAALINFVNLGLTPISGGRGSAHYTYGSLNDWRMDTYAQGAPVTPPFTAANYTAAPAGAWGVDAGDLFLETFYLNGRTLLYAFSYVTTSVSGSPFSLVRALPFGWQAAALGTANDIVVADGGVHRAGAGRILAVTGVSFQLLPLNTAWATATNAVALFGQITILLN